MANVILEKSLIASEDIDIGLGKSQQKRGTETVEVSQVNASELLGMLILETVAQLEVLDPATMKVRAVFVQETKCIYTYLGSEWVTNYNQVYVIDAMSNSKDIPNGFSVCYSISDNKLYYKAGTTWLANGQYVYAVPTSQEVSLLPQGAKMAIAIDTGTLFVNTAGMWNRISLDVNGDPILIVDTVDELPLNVTNILTCIVKDRKRGGIFLYDKTYSEANDGGININGWRRQYEGKVSVLWFGADNNGATDSAGAFNQAFRHGNVIIPAGTYKVSQLVQVSKDLMLEGFGATIELTDSGAFMFGIEDSKETWAQCGDIIGSGNVFGLDSPQLYNYGYYGRFRSTSPFSGHTTSLASQMSKLISLNGLQCYIGDFFKYSYSAAQLKIIKPYRININGLTINSTSDNTAVYFTNVCDSVIDNTYINSFYADCIKIKDCANFKLTNLVATVDTTGQFTSMIVDGADNLIIDSAIIRGSLAGIQFINTPSNYIGIYRSIISGDTSVDNKGLTMALNFEDTQLLGKLLVGGYNLKFNNCTMIMPYIHMLGWAGGSCEFLHCSMIGNSTTSKYNFIKVSNNLLFEGNYNLAAGCDYVVRDCTFQGTEFYSGMYFIECIGRNNQNSKNNALISNVIVDGLRLDIDIGTVVAAFGYFNTIKVRSISCKVQPVALDMKQLYLNNLASLSGLGLETLVPICNNFYTDLVSSVTITKLPSEINGNITKKYTEASGFLLNQTVPIQSITVIPPTTAWRAEKENYIEISKLKDKDVVKFAMLTPITIKGA